MLLGGALADLDLRARAPVAGVVRVAAPRRRLPVPDRVDRDVGAAQRVGHERVAEVLEDVAFHVRRQGGRELLAGHAPELGSRDQRRPALRPQHADVGPVVQRLLGEERPLREVDEMGPHVVEPFALLLRVEEPDGPRVRRAGHHLLEVVHALHVDSRLGFAAREQAAEGGRVVHQLALQLGGHLEALGHDVERDEPFLLGGGQGALELRQVVFLEDPRLVDERMQIGVERGLHAIDLPPVASRDHHGVPGMLLEHPLQEIRAGVDLELPRRRVARAPVEPRHPRQMVHEVGAQRRVHVHLCGNARVHLLLDEGGVEVAGVQRDESDVGHGRAPLGQGHRESERGDRLRGHRWSLVRGVSGVKAGYHHRDRCHRPRARRPPRPPRRSGCSSKPAPVRVCCTSSPA